MLKSNRFGFTLMEIMVVIIVIAVLASVGSSMISTLVDQSKTSATKQRIDSLKKALLAYQADVGRMPYDGAIGCSSYELAYNNATHSLLCYNENNALISSVLLPNKLKKRWKGPYIDTEPEEFMFDAWDNPIQYVASKKNLYLWSYGPPEYEPDNPDPEKVLKALQNKDEYADDIVVSIKRFKKSLAK